MSKYLQLQYEKCYPGKHSRTNARGSTYVGDYDITVYRKLNNPKINEPEVTVKQLTFEKYNKESVPYWPIQISVKTGISKVHIDIKKIDYSEKANCNLHESTAPNGFVFTEDTMRYVRKVALKKAYKPRDFITYGDTERTNGDDIQNIRGKCDTVKSAISDLKNSSSQERTSLSDSPIGVCAYMRFAIKTAEKRLRNRTNRLYELIKDKTDNECESFLTRQRLPDILPLLASALANAISSGNHKKVAVIRSYVTNRSSEIVEQFRDTYKEILLETNVWMGTECHCNKSEKGIYESKICNEPMPLLIVEVNGDLKFLNTDEFHGFQIKVITDSSFRKNESRVVADEQLPESQQPLNKVPKSKAKQLFKQHSNLTMVCPSAFKSIGFETKEHTVLKKNCISLFCRVKGIIPIGEHHFPLKINEYQTDVLEGTSYFTSAVHIGDKIYNSKGEIGTLGGFVKYYGIDTFLTCAHVIFGKSNISNLQTKDIHFNCHTITNDNSNEPVKCTLIRHILKYDSAESNMEEDDMQSAENEDETSIDAALVLIQMPNSLHDPIGNCCAMADTTARCANKPVELRIKLKGYGDQTDLSTLGLKSMYLNENFIDTEVQHSRAIALSAITGRQERLISLSKSDKLSVLVPTHVKMNTNIMYNQFVVQNMDFQEGDSGTCIYSSFTGSDDIGCIGMLIGKSTSGACIVTPMKEILKALEVDSKS